MSTERTAPLSVSARSEIVLADSAYRFRHVGVNPFEAYYPCVITPRLSFGSLALAANSLIAVPFYLGRRALVDRVGVNVTGAGGIGSQFRFGLYASTDEEDVLYPDRLLFDSGAEDGTVGGAHIVNSAITLPGNRLYFAAIVGTAVAATIRTVVAAGTPYGLSATLNDVNPGTHLAIAFAFAALPTAFPRGATVQYAAETPMIAVRLADMSA